MILFKTSFISILNIFFRILFGLVLNKIIAVSAGPAGLVTFAQFQNIIQIAVQGSQLGVLSGYTKYLVKYKRNQILYPILKNTILTILSIGTVISLIILLACSDKIIIAINYSGNTRIILYVIAGSLLFYNLGAYLIATLVGLELPVRASILNLLQTLFLILVTLPLAYFNGVIGAIIGLMLSQVIWSISAIFFSKIPRVISLDYGTIQFSKGIGKRLSGYMLSGLIVATAGPLSLFFIRTHAIQLIGADQVGLWQALQSISSIYMSIVVMIITTFYFPKFSASERKSFGRSGSSVFLEACSFALGLYLTFAVCLYILGNQIISLAFSEKFVLVVDYILYQLVSDFFRVIIITITYFLLARGEQSKFIIVELFSTFSVLFIFFIFIEKDVTSIFYSYIVSGSISLAIACSFLIIVFRKEAK